MELIIAENYDEMSRKAAHILAAQVTLKPASVLGLATGSTPLGIYEYLAEWYREGDLDFSQVTTVNLDEYYGLSPENEQSYHYFMETNLFSKVNLPAGKHYLPDGKNTDSQAECRRYEDVVDSLGGMDLQLLGLGHNGHIGFNEPASCFEKEVHLVNLSGQTIEANKRFFASADEVPKQAYTMGIGTILKARKILLVVSGEQKAQALRSVVQGKVSPQVPGSILQFHPDVVVVADRAATAALE